MNVHIQCNVRLSKKLEKFAENGEPVEIYISPIKDGEATGFIKMSVKNNTNMEELNSLGETSIIMRVVRAEESVPDLENEAPLQCLFSDRQPGAGGSPTPHFTGESAVDQLAITDPNASPLQQYAPPIVAPPPTPEQIQQLARQVPQLQQQGRRQPVAQVRSQVSQYATTAYSQQPQYAQQPPPQPVYEAPPIMSYQELYAELQRVPGIEKEVPLLQMEANLSPQSQRQIMLQHEQRLNMLPRLQRPCYLANYNAGRLEIADMGYTMLLNQVINLTNIPARRLLDSRHLESLCNEGYLKFVTKQQFVESLEAPDPVMRTYEKVGNLDEIAGDSEDDGLAINRNRRMRSRMDRQYGLRRAEQSDRVDGEAPIMDPEFAELVASMPSARGGGAVVRQINQPKIQHISTKTKMVTRVDDGGFASGGDDGDLMDSVYMP